MLRTASRASSMVMPDPRKPSRLRSSAMRPNKRCCVNTVFPPKAFASLWEWTTALMARSVKRSKTAEILGEDLRRTKGLDREWVLWEIEIPKQEEPEEVTGRRFRSWRLPWHSTETRPKSGEKSLLQLTDSGDEDDEHGDGNDTSIKKEMWG